MSNLKLLRTILRLESLQITHFRFMHRDTELHLAVKPYKNGCRCPACGRRGRIVRQTTELRRWEDVAVMGLRVVLWYAPKEIQCPTHGRMQEEIPGAPVYARVTYRLEWRLCALCQIMTQKAAAEILRLPTSTLSNLLHRVITRVRHGHTIRGLTTLGVDEISYCKGRKFATLVYDLDRARVLWVGPGKGRDTIDRFFNDWLSRGQTARVAWASCDMSPAYIGAITHHCPHVTLVLDRFHLVKALNQAVDEVRKSIRRGERPSRDCGGCSAGTPDIAPRATPGSSTACGTPIGASIVRGCSRTSSSTSGTTAIRPRRRRSSDAG